MTDRDLLIALLRGDVPAARRFGAVAGADGIERFIAAAEHHGVLPLVAKRLADAGSTAPGPLRDRVAALARQHAAIDLMRERELIRALAALSDATVSPIIFKGSHLAYVCYERPDLRPRLDADVLIQPERAAREAAHRTLTALGYSTPPHVGDIVMGQRTYALRDAGQLRHAVDLHWRLSNPVAFADALTWEDLDAAAVAVPALGPAARGPSLWHALAIACVHRIAHHAGSDSLIWLYDIDRLARRMSGEAWTAWRSLVARGGIANVSITSLRAAAQTFATPVPEWVAAFGDESRERSAVFLDGPRTGIAGAIEDWRAASGWRARVRLAGAHLIPPAQYMREVYAPGSRAPLAWLYVKRALSGARRWLTSRT